MRKQLETMSGKAFMDGQKGDFTYIEVKYFEPTELINYGGEEMAEMMNEKVDVIKDRYENALQALEQYNRKQQSQIMLFRALENKGNVGIAFDEMSTEQVIEKLSFIE